MPNRWMKSKAIPYAPEASTEKAPRRGRGETRVDIWLDAAHAALLMALAVQHGGNVTATIREALTALFVLRPRAYSRTVCSRCADETSVCPVHEAPVLAEQQDAEDEERIEKIRVERMQFGG